ncbi:MAG: PEP/pyruvate-binding domain-containing protein [Chloroflexi bacterium]|nr:PEP/pyruvate-binding domain-containing protein [Chloroflexota bacterium]MBI3762886.1 PEP/pyruvate-binding domain-containing protein [Chloroflexota bacterium]
MERHARPEMPKVLELFLEIRQFPMLAERIRARMRLELFARGVVSEEAFEQEVRDKAIQSQKREGLSDPLREEPADVWAERLARIRDYITDFYFAYNLPHEQFRELVRAVLAERMPQQDVVLTFNPELAPWDLLFAQGETYENFPPDKRRQVEHHLEEIVVVLIKTMISDHLDFVSVAKEWFTIADLKEIRRRRIGRGKIGGKAAGMLLAYKIWQATADPSLRDLVKIPRSYFIGADVFYDFISVNGPMYWINQKYRSEEEIRAEYPEIQRAYVGGRFPEGIVQRLRDVLEEIGPTPIIVRSSSLLEDNFGTSFAGKYESHFLANQGTPEENLRALTTAISRIYASVYSPDAMAYRRRMKLIDYDERMAILLQEVQGICYRRWYFPQMAGVGYSHNPYVWTPKIRRDEGFARIVWGLGTRAVDQVANDYPRLVALSHPALRPEADARAIKRYSQRFVDVIDLEANAFNTLPVTDVIAADYPGLRWLAVADHGDYLQPLITAQADLAPPRLVLTFDTALRETKLVPLLRALLQTLERRYNYPVDVEFTAALPDTAHSGVQVSLLQCRPQSLRYAEGPVRLPVHVSADDKIFSTSRLVPDGTVERIRYVVYVDPRAYAGAPDNVTRLEVARVIGRLNRRLEGETFVLLGPGRWGSGNVDLGVKVTYADIYNTRALIEVVFADGDALAEPSFGTHFFQDLVEARIFPLALFPNDSGAIFNARFFDDGPNALAELLPADANCGRIVKVIDVPKAHEGRYLALAMDGERGEALGYLKRYD